MSSAGVAVIGGSGFYNMEGFHDTQEVDVDTPFGKPSGTIRIGTLEGRRVAFLPRHDAGHRILPTDLPAKANIYALKALGVRQIIAVSAVGSLRQDIEPLHLVVPDQIIDRTRGRDSTFFGGGLVAHIAFADPFCPHLAAAVLVAAKETSATVHKGGTYVCIEGPAFSTRAESNLYRQWGCDVIGMTAIPEAKLAREAEICYATLACATDYDCWYEEHDSVTADMIIANLLRNVEVSKQVVRNVVSKLPEDPAGCACNNALKTALVTSFDMVPVETKRNLAAIIGRYLG